MFEKEAVKDYLDNLEGKLEVNNESRLEEQFEDTFIRGAICGYNKANEWHYVKDGDLPKNNTECIVIKEYEGVNGKYTRRKISLYKDNMFLIWNHEYKSYIQLHNVIAWKEIVLPKESE